MNNDQEWNDDKPEHLNNIIYKCFLDGYCASANIPFLKQYSLVERDRASLREAKTAARAYVKYREEKSCEK